MFGTKPTKKELLAYREHVEFRLNDLQQQLNALTNHLNLNIYKPHESYRVAEKPIHTGLGLAAAPTSITEPWR